MPKLASGEEGSEVRESRVRDGLRTVLPRTLGLILLLILLLRINISHLLITLQQAHIGLVILAMIVLIILIGIKTIRWKMILQRLDIYMSSRDAFLAYFASIFIGFLTPGRLGEFGRALYIRDDSNAQLGLGFSSVLADRLFDLYALLFVGCAAILSLGTTQYWIWAISFLIVCLLPIFLFLNNRSFSWMKAFTGRLGRFGKSLFARDGWLWGIRRGLQKLDMAVLYTSTFLTAAAYLVYFSQCYLLSKALAMDVNFTSIMFAVALGSLITLLPFSISGLGTREATIIAYMSTVGVSAEIAFSFSFFVFITFYIVGGLFGAIAWLVHPIKLDFNRGKAD